MRKAYQLANLDCANCAAKLERKIQKLEGVTDAAVNFMAMKLTVEAADEQFDAVMNEVRALAKKLEPDLTISA